MITPAPIIGFPTSGFPITNITPLTVRDGYTYLEKMEALRNWVRNDLVTWMETTATGLQIDWNEQVTTLIETVNSALSVQAGNVNEALADQLATVTTALGAQLAHVTEILDAQTADNDTKIAALTDFVNDAVESIIDSTIAVSDPVVYGVINDPASQSATKIHAMIKSDNMARGVMEAGDYGPIGLLSTLNAAITAAEAKGKHTKLHVPAGVWDVGNGLSLNGKSVVIVGDGTGGPNEANPTGTVFYASTQTGPVIDFTGWQIPAPGFDGKVSFGGFLVQGSNVADPTLNNSGLKFTAMSSASFTDIAIRRTGGPCIDMGESIGNAVYTCDFERIILKEPVAMNTNDVPFFRANECNGNRFRGFGLHSQGHTIGVSGAVQIINNASFSATDNLFDAWWFENTIIPSGGTVFNHRGNTSIIRDFQFFDVFKVSGATGTSLFRMNAPTNAKNYGTNLISGVIPGAGGALDPDIGIEMKQSRNRVQGVKSYRGFSGSNVVISAGVLNTYVDLAGQYTPGLPAVVDLSGNQTNIVVDSTALQFPGGGTGLRRTQSGRFYGPADHTTTPIAQVDGVSVAVPIWLPVAATFTEIDCQVTVAGAAGTLVRLGIYANDPSKDMPASLLLDAGTVDGSTASMKSKTFTPLTLQAGLYWLSATPQGGAPTLTGIANSLAPVANSTAIGPMVAANCYTMSGVTGALAAWSATATPAAGAPKIALKTQ